MDKDISDRINQRLAALNMSAAKASRLSGMSADFIRDLKRRPIKPGAESLAKLARTLKTTPDFLLYGKAESPTVVVEGLPVIGVVEAGQFRDITLVSQDEEYETVNVVRDEKFPHARQYALLVSGDSMNEKFADGSYVICVSFPDTGLQLRSGMVVHVERHIAGTHLIETTLKEVQDRAGRRLLIPRSTNPRHKPIEVNGDEKTEIKVQGLVVGSYTPVRY